MNARRIIPIVLSLIYIIVIGCSNTVPVRVQYPAEFDIGSPQRIAVLDFGFRGSWDFSQTRKPPATLSKSEATILKSQLDAQPVPAMPNPIKAYPGTRVASQFISTLIQNGNYSVMSQDEVLRSLEENHIPVSQFLTNERAVDIGNLLRVDMLILVGGRYSVEDVVECHGESAQTDKKTPDSSLKYRINRKVDVDLTYRVIDVATSALVISETNRVANYRERGLFPAYHDYAEKTRVAETHACLKGWHNIVEGLVDQAVKESVKQIAPHSRIEQRKLKQGKSLNMIAAMKYVQQGSWEKARQAWEAVLADSSSSAQKDYLAAQYNLGMYYECNGQSEKAIRYYQQCYKDTGEKAYLQAQVRLQERENNSENTQ